MSPSCKSLFQIIKEIEIYFKHLLYIRVNPKSKTLFLTKIKKRVLFMTQFEKKGIKYKLF
jgi:hypothetical protein